MTHKEYGITTALVDNYIGDKFTKLRYRLYDYGLPNSSRTSRMASGRGRSYNTLMLKCYKQVFSVLLQKVGRQARARAGVVTRLTDHSQDAEGLSRLPQSTNNGVLCVAPLSCACAHEDCDAAGVNPNAGKPAVPTALTCVTHVCVTLN